MKKKKPDPEVIATQAIIAAIENGTAPWRQSWRAGGGYPMRANGEYYRGINVLLLMICQFERGYTHSRWMTYNQADALGANVRFGQKGTDIIKYGTREVKVDPKNPLSEETRSIAYTATYRVFNVEQIDGLPAEYYDQASPEVAVEWNHALEQTLAKTKAQISWSGDRAYYAPGPDHIVMPDRDRFADAEQAYTTLCHELVHWTGAKHRLNRDFSRVKEAYAREELVAELGAAFMGCRFGFRPDHIEDHAAYIASWLKILREDSSAIMKAAAHAQKACDLLFELMSAESTNDMALAA